MDSKCLFKLFGVRFTAFGIICAGAFALLVAQMIVDCRRNRGKIDSVAVFGIIALPLTLVASRLVFVLGSIMYYVDVVQSFAPVFRISDGGFSFMGAVIAIIGAGFITDRIYKGKNRRFSLTGAAALALPFAIAVERLGEYGTGMGLGKVVYTPWMEKIAIADAAGTLVHPVFMYEAVCAAAIGIIMRIVCTKKKEMINGGDVLNIFLTLFGSCQITLESLRKDGHLVVHFVRIQQIIALLMVIAALVRWAMVMKKCGQLKKSTIAVMCAIVLVCTLLCVKQEFAVDSSENPWMDYGIMAFSSAILCLSVLMTGRNAMKCRASKIAAG